MRLGRNLVQVDSYDTKELLDVNGMVGLILFVIVQEKAGEAGRRS